MISCKIAVTVTGNIVRKTACIVPNRWLIPSVYVLALNSFPLPTKRQCLSHDGCMKVRMEQNHNCFMLYCVWQLFLNSVCWVWFRLFFVFIKLASLCSRNHFVLVLFAFVVFGFCFCNAKPKYWLGRMSPNWPNLCLLWRYMTCFVLKVPLNPKHQART